jgi:hypothetical protein
VNKWRAVRELNEMKVRWKVLEITEKDSSYQRAARMGVNCDHRDDVEFSTTWAGKDHESEEYQYRIQSVK